MIYDTSFIMNDNDCPDFSSGRMLGENFFHEEHVIPIEVKKELFKHFDSPDKNTAARHGRTFVAKIMSREDYHEVSLEDVPCPSIIESVLGPDSIVDKKLIGYAMRFLKEDPQNIAFIATNDGGIQTEVSALQTQRKLNIFSPVSTEKCDYTIRSIQNNLLVKLEMKMRRAMIGKRIKIIVAVAIPVIVILAVLVFAIGLELFLTLVFFLVIPILISFVLIWMLLRQ
jgi:hypothetical protein